jgi:hypothetical protein
MASPSSLSAASRDCSLQMTLPRSVYRVPQRRANWATRNSPRPPSSVVAARRRCGDVLLPSETSQIRLSRSYSSRRRMGSLP